ncbi:unnamed protein product [Peniophora sp. CBMAI 1063]|nr:unnamed protein product [Peniophora sp. CBMAI 1063]
MSVGPPAHSDAVKVAIPAEHVLLLSMNRPKALNAMSFEMEQDLRTLLDWFDEEPSLWVVIVTGEGRAFCAGADLKLWKQKKEEGYNDQERIAANVHGFGSLSRRIMAKPIIACVNGDAYGGAVEILLNCDIVISSEDASFALPEVKRGVIAAQGVIPRLRTSAGHQFAAEMLFLGRKITAIEAQQRFGFVNLVVPRSQLLSTAVDWAKEITQNSPDAVQATKRGLVIASRTGDNERAVLDHAWSAESKRAYTGENIKEGLVAFSEKRGPHWKNPAKL